MNSPISTPGAYGHTMTPEESNLLLIVVVSRHEIIANLTAVVLHPIPRRDLINLCSSP